MVPGSVVPSIIAAKAMRTDRELVEELRQVRAVTSASAVALHRTPLRSRRIAGLVRHGVLQGAPQDRYFLDESAWESYQLGRRQRMLLIIGVVTLTVVTGLLVGAISL